jgi:hypothetical protein
MLQLSLTTGVEAHTVCFHAILMSLRLIRNKPVHSEPTPETNSAVQPTLKRQNSTEATLDTPARKRSRQTDITEIRQSTSHGPPAPAQKIDIQPLTEEVRAQMAKLANVW